MDRTLYERSGAARWGLTRERFVRALPEDAPADGPLHVEDLALAVACADGIEAAWDHFVREYQPLLRRAAVAIDAAGGEELADSLIADLYGLTGKGEKRASLFQYFQGRSRLGTWLRSVLAQRHIDRYRATRRLEPLPDRDAELQGAVAATDTAGPDRRRFAEIMRRALASALAALAPRDRLRLALYYGQGVTLAAIGRRFREHEATASRHLSRTRREIRAHVETTLRTHEHMDERTIEECFRSVTADPGTLDLTGLTAVASGGKNALLNRSEG